MSPAERDASPGSPAAGAWPAPSAAWYAVGVFTLALTFNQIDANSVALLVTPIKRDLHLSEVEVSLLQGFALVPFYLFVGIPLSHVVDRTNRKRMLAGAIGFWSLATACCSVAQSFRQLFLARFLIGAGESVNGPATYSLLADYFPPRKLPRAIGALQLGFIGGNALSFLGGGLAVQALATLPDTDLPLVGTVHNWQLLFLFAGLPGLAVAGLLLTLVEPPRRDRGAPIAAAGDVLREWQDVFRHLGRRWRVFVPMFVGLGFSSIALFGTNQWLFTFFIRTYHWQPAQAGPAIGAAQFVGSLVGLAIGLWLNQRFVSAGRDDTNIRVLIIAQLVRVPIAIATPLMPDPWLAVLLNGLTNMSAMIGAPSQNAALQLVTPGRMRGRVTALYLFMFTVVGNGIGPTFVAAITQHVLGADELIRYSLAIAAAVLGPTAVTILWLGLRPYGREIARLREEAAAEMMS